MGNLVALDLIFSIIIMAVGMIFTRQILQLSGADGVILEIATHYLRIIFAGSLFVNFAQSVNMIMRGEGTLKRAMSISAGAAILYIILDPIFITILNPVGQGAQGAAYATILSQFVQAALTLWYFLKKNPNVKIHGIRLEKGLFSQIFGVEFSAMLMQVMLLVQQTVLYNVAAQTGGNTWQLILGATLRVQSFAFIPLWGLSQGYQPAVGTNYGAKQYDRVKYITKIFALAATLLALIFYLPIMLAPKAMLSLFITDSAVAAQGQVILECSLSPILFWGFGFYPYAHAVSWQSLQSKCIGYHAPDCHLHSGSYHHASRGRTWCAWGVFGSVGYRHYCILCCDWYDVERILTIRYA